MAELIPTASEAEWLEARRQGVTASEIPIILGLSPWSSPYALYHQKLGILPSDVDSAVMERGRVLEPYIAEKFAAAHPELFVEGDGRELYRHSDRPWMMATPDRLAWESDRHYAYRREPVAVAEFKTASDMSEWGEPGTDEIPVHYRAQVLWQCEVMDVSRWYVTVLDVPRWEIREYTGEIDDAARKDQEVMFYQAKAFLMRLEFGQVPDVDSRPATIGALKALHPSVEDFAAEIGPQLADRYEAAARNAKHWEQRKRLYEAQIRETAGSARRIVRTGPGQVPVARRDVYEVREHTRKASTVDKLVLTPPKPKKES